MSNRALKKYLTTVCHAATVAFVVLAWPAMVAAQSPPAPEKPPAAKPKDKAPEPGQKTLPPEADAKAKPKSPQFGKVVPDTPAERAKLLDDLYAHLATAPDEQAAKPYAETIEKIWLTSGSDTVSALMERAMQAVHHQRNDLALQLLSAVVELAPDFAEGWNRRAYVFYTEGDYERALGDLRRVLALDPSHYKALDGLGQIMRQLDRKPQALQAYEKLLAVHPFWPNVQTVVDELRREVEGRGL